MSHAVSLVNAFAAAWADAFFRACWQGGLGIALVWLLCRLWPALPANPRCWLWRLAYAKLLFGLVWLPPLALPLLPAPPAAPPVAPPVVQAIAPPVPTLPDDAPLTAIDPAPSAAPPVFLAAPTILPAPVPLPPPCPTLPTPQTWLLAAWLLGVFAGLGRVASAWRRACALSRASRPLADDTLQADAADLSRRLGQRRVPPLHVADGLASPLLLGLGRPTILLPAFVVSGSPRLELRLMLAHELAHLARRDLLWNVLPQTAQRLFFFHPLVWLAGHEWALAQEIACDSLAVETTGTPPSAYGRMLLGIATRRPSAAPLFPTLAVAAPRHTLRRRLHAMQHIGTLSRPRLILAAALTALLAVGGLVPWRVVAQSGASVSAVPTTQVNAAQGDGIWQDQERKRQADIAVKNAQLDVQLAAVQNHLPVTQTKTARAYIRWINADYAANQLAVQLSEQQRADFVATHPNSLTNAQATLVQKVILDKLNHKHISKDVRAKLAAIPTKQQDRVAWLRYCDLNITFARMRAFEQKRVSVFQLRTEYSALKQRRAGSLPMQDQSQGAAIKAALAPPQAKTASFDTVAVGSPPRLRLAQSVAPPPVPPGVTQTEAEWEELERKQQADLDARNAQADAQLAEIQKHLPPAQLKAIQSQIAFANAEYAKEQRRVQVSERSRTAYIASHPNRLSDAQIAFVKTFNWNQMHHSPISGRVRAEMAAIPKDQRDRVTILRSYDGEISGGRMEALIGKQAWVEVLRQRIAGKGERTVQPHHTSAATHGYKATLYSFAPKGQRVRVFTKDATGQHLILDKVSDGGVTKSPPVPVTEGNTPDFFMYDNGKLVKVGMPGLRRMRVSGARPR